MSDRQISALFLIWSFTGLIVGVPTGAIADRFGYRFALVADGTLQASAYVVWLTCQSFAGFAVGFVLWGLGGALGSGALEALVYDDLVAAGAQTHYSRIAGSMTAAGLIAQVPGAIAATALYPFGGFQLIGWVSVGSCLISAIYASTLPTTSRQLEADEPGRSYLQTLRSGVHEAWTHPRVRVLVVLFAALFSLDAVEEYFSLLAQDWGVPTAVVPIAIVSVPLLGALGATLAGRLNPDSDLPLARIMLGSTLLFGGAGLLHHPAGLIGIAAFYFGYRLVVVILEVRLQHAIEGRARATVTSVADFLVDVMCLVIYALWAWGGLLSFVCLAIAMAAALGLASRVDRKNRLPNT